MSDKPKYYDPEDGQPTRDRRGIAMLYALGESCVLRELARLERERDAARKDAEGLLRRLQTLCTMTGTKMEQACAELDAWADAHPEGRG